MKCLITQGLDMMIQINGHHDGKIKWHDISGDLLRLMTEYQAELNQGRSAESMAYDERFDAISKWLELIIASPASTVSWPPEMKKAFSI